MNGVCSFIQTEENTQLTKRFFSKFSFKKMRSLIFLSTGSKTYALRLPVLVEHKGDGIGHFNCYCDSGVRNSTLDPFSIPFAHYRSSDAAPSLGRPSGWWRPVVVPRWHAPAPAGNGRRRIRPTTAIRCPTSRIWRTAAWVINYIY